MPEAANAKAVSDTFGDELTWCSTTGRAASAQPSSVVRVSGG